MFSTHLSDFVTFFQVGLTTVLLPETNKKKLPDTLEEGEAFLRVNNPLPICSSL